MFKYIYSHPIKYFYKGITIFPTITFANIYRNYLSCLGEVSLFLGIINSLPIPVTDGGQALMCLLENKFPEFKTNPFKYRRLGYLVILFIVIFPIVVVFFQNIKTMWPMFIIIGYIVYKFITVKI